MKKESNLLTLQNRQNTLHLAYWTLAWTLSMALIAFGPKFLWNEQKSLSIGFIILNTLIGLGMIMANKKHLNGLDELQKKILMDAMAVTLGLSVVLGLSYSMLDIHNIVPFDAEISHLVVLMGLSYLSAVIIGHYRYR